MRRLVDVTTDQIPEILRGCSEEEIQASILLGKSSRPLHAGYLDDEFLFLYGLVPPTILSESAYVWVHTSPAVAGHKVAVGRWAKRLLAQIYQSYPQIWGHCSSESWKWIASLGAKVISESDYITFELWR